MHSCGSPWPIASIVLLQMNVKQPGVFLAVFIGNEGRPSPLKEAVGALQVADPHHDRALWPRSVQLYGLDPHMMDRAILAGRVQQQASQLG